MDTKEMVLLFLEKSVEEIIQVGFLTTDTSVDGLLAQEGEIFKKQLEASLDTDIYYLEFITAETINGTNAWLMEIEDCRPHGLARVINFSGFKTPEGEDIILFIAGASRGETQATPNEWAAENAVSIPVKELYAMNVLEVCRKIQETLKNLWDKLLTVKANQEEN